jgi:G:T-mismatch repair DNA endonuclease (very short patch repair protein)
LQNLNTYFEQHVLLKGAWGMYEADFVVNDNIVLEVDGIYWHYFPWGRPIDRMRTTRLLANGYKVIRIWEHEAMSQEMTEDVLSFILENIKKPNMQTPKDYVKKLIRCERLAKEKNYDTDSYLDEIWVDKHDD